MVPKRKVSFIAYDGILGSSSFVMLCLFGTTSVYFLICFCMLLMASNGEDMIQPLLTISTSSNEIWVIFYHFWPKNDGDKCFKKYF